MTVFAFRAVIYVRTYSCSVLLEARGDKDALFLLICRIDLVVVYTLDDAAAGLANGLCR